MTTPWWQHDRASNASGNHAGIGNGAHPMRRRKRTISTMEYNMVEEDLRRHNNDVIITSLSANDMCLISPSKVDVAFDYDSVVRKVPPPSPKVVRVIECTIPRSDIPETPNPPPTPRKLSIDSSDLNCDVLAHESHRVFGRQSSSKGTNPQRVRVAGKPKRYVIQPKTEADFCRLPPHSDDAARPTHANALPPRRLLTPVNRAKSPVSQNLIRVTMDGGYLPQARAAGGKQAITTSLSRMLASGKWENFSLTRREQGQSHPGTPSLPEVETNPLPLQHKLDKVARPASSLSTRPRSSGIRKVFHTRTTPVRQIQPDSGRRDIITPDVRSINCRTSGSMDALKSLEDTLSSIQQCRTPFYYFKHDFADGDNHQKFVKKWLAAGPTQISFATK